MVDKLHVKSTLSDLSTLTNMIYDSTEFNHFTSDQIEFFNIFCAEKGLTNVEIIGHDLYED